MSRFKRTYLANEPSIFFASLLVVLVLGLSLALAGCGELSLIQLLENEDPGDFKLNPSISNVPADTSIAIQGQGGFKPYTYSKVTGLGDLDTKTGVYVASGGAETAEIEATDFFGNRDTVTIVVFNRLTLKVGGEVKSQITIDTTMSVDFDADGGLAIGGYPFYLNGIDTGASPLNGQWTFGPEAPGTYVVEVLDDLENSAIVTVHVILSGGELGIDPTIAYVIHPNTIAFNGINVQGTATYTATAGTFTSNIYTPPSPPYTGVVTVTLIDDFDSESVNATVHVLDSALDPLSISPSSFGEELEYADKVTFTVSGGLPPYTFWLVYDGGHGTLEQISATQALYTAPNFNTVDWVWVKDALDDSIRVKTKVRDD
jgi:hypothetical protein